MNFNIVYLLGLFGQRYLNLSQNVKCDHQISKIRFVGHKQWYSVHIAHKKNYPGHGFEPVKNFFALENF